MEPQDRLKIVVDGDGNADRETPPPTATRQKQPARLRPSRALPTDRAKFDTQTEALRAFPRASNRGDVPVGSADVAARLSIGEATAALVNGFFVEAGFLTKEGKGRYKPVEAVNEYERLYDFDKDEARKQLAEPLRKSWYFTSVESELRTGKVAEGILVNVLARAAGAAGDRKPQLELILDWLEYAGLIVREGGDVTLADGATASTPPKLEDDGGLDDPGAGASGDAGEVTTEDGANGPRTKLPPQAAHILGFSFEFSITADDLAKLTPEQITALFEAVGKVMAIKAATS